MTSLDGHMRDLALRGGCIIQLQESSFDITRPCYRVVTSGVPEGLFFFLSRLTAIELLADLTDQLWFVIT